VTLALRYKGFDYVAFYDGAYENNDSLPSLVQTHANSIEATLDYGIDVNTSQVVADPNYTDSLAALGQTIAQAESLGLSVMVRPLIDFLDPAIIGNYTVGEWRQDYQPTNVAAFFASYQKMIVAEAQVAQANGAQMLSIGAELDQLAGPQYLPYWTSIIDAVRAVFSGKLTYSASWTTAGNVSFWNQLDYMGIDCYVPLSNAQNPTLQDLIDGWTQPATQATNPGAFAYIGNQSPIQYFETLAAQAGRPLIFTELGYANDSNAAAQPSAEGNNPDPALQAELYQAFFDAWEQAGNLSLVGTFFWEWDPDSANGGPTIDSFSPQNDPAQNAVTAGFGSVGSPQVSNDFNGAGCSDLLLQNGSSLADWTIWNGAVQAGYGIGSVGGWNLIGTGDFTGNGTTDLLLQNGASLAEWFMQNGAYQGSAIITNGGVPAGWSVIGTGDFNGDGTTDMLLQNGSLLVDWTMQNGALQHGYLIGALPANWSVVATGDFTGNGTTDLLLQDGSYLADWLIQNGVLAGGAALGMLPLNWKVAGTGDFTGNGTSDLLLENGTQLADWTINNNAIVAGYNIGPLPSGWNIVGVGNYTGNGTDGLLLQNGTQLAIWTMQNGSVENRYSLATLPLNWNPVTTTTGLVS